MGIAAAYERALDEAKLDYFSFLAGDGEIDRGSVRDILAAVGRADIVAPYHQNPRARQLHRRFLTWASTGLVNVLFGLKMRYYQGPCIYPIALARALPKAEGGFYFLTQMLIHALHAGHSCGRGRADPRGAGPRPLEGRVDHEHPEGAPDHRPGVVGDLRQA